MILISAMLAALAAAPSVELVYSGDRLGKVEPCGCPQNPMGHIARQVAFVEGHRRSGSAALYFDLGNLFFEDLKIADERREQHARRAAILSRALKRMRLDFLVPGPTDFAAGFGGYKRLVQGAGVVVLAADLTTPSGALAFSDSLLVERGGLKILVVGIAGFVPVDSGLLRLAPSAAVRRARAAAGDVDLTIVASHLDRSGGLALASAEPGLAAVLIADRHLHLIPKEAGGTVVVGSSKQGKHLGLLHLSVRGEGGFGGGITLRRLQAKHQRSAGVERAALQQRIDAILAGNLYDYRATGMGEEKAADPEVVRWVKSYVHFVGRFEQQRGVAPPGYSGDGDFAGVDACTSCHGEIVKKWRTTRHSHAFQSLLDRGQQLDRECIGCHSAGWRHPGGFSDPRAVGILKNVQCESCHGPGKAHAASADKRLIDRGVAGAEFCQRCHQEELETGFNEAGYIPRIKHW